MCPPMTRRRWRRRWRTSRCRWPLRPTRWEGGAVVCVALWDAEQCCRGPWMDAGRCLPTSAGRQGAQPLRVPHPPGPALPRPPCPCSAPSSCTWAACLTPSAAQPWTMACWQSGEQALAVLSMLAMCAWGSHLPAAAAGCAAHADRCLLRPAPAAATAPSTTARTSCRTG